MIFIVIKIYVIVTIPSELHMNLLNLITAFLGEKKWGIQYWSLRLRKQYGR